MCVCVCEREREREIETVVITSTAAMHAPGVADVTQDVIRFRGRGSERDQT